MHETFTSNEVSSIEHDNNLLQQPSFSHKPIFTSLIPLQDSMGKGKWPRTTRPNINVCRTPVVFLGFLLFMIQAMTVSTSRCTLLLCFLVIQHICLPQIASRASPCNTGLTHYVYHPLIVPSLQAFGFSTRTRACPGKVCFQHQTRPPSPRVIQLHRRYPPRPPSYQDSYSCSTLPLPIVENTTATPQ